MRVILKKYDEKLGDVGEIVEVRSGYANNYLIPQGIALIASSGNINQMKLVKKAAIKVEAKNVNDAEKLAVSLKDIVLNFVVKTGEEGKLYGSITNKDIAEKIKDEKNIEVDRKKIDLEEHIKELGEYEIDIKLYKEIKATIKVIIEPDQESKGLIEAHEKEKAEKSDKEKAESEVKNITEKNEEKIVEGSGD